MTCNDCIFLNTDSDRNTFWFICTHPLHGGEEIVGEEPAIGSSLDTPDWCPFRRI